MVKHTQTFRGQQLTNCLSVFDHFLGLALKGLNIRQKPCEIFHQKSGWQQIYRPLTERSHDILLKISFDIIYHIYTDLIVKRIVLLVMSI